MRQDNIVARVDQETSVVVIKDSVVPPLEEGTAARPADVGSVQVTGDVQSQRLTGGAGPCRKKRLRLQMLRRALVVRVLQQWQMQSLVQPGAGR